MHIMNSLNILCFGDSITAGWCHWGGGRHPYAGTMLSSLEIALKTPDITADVEGAPGDQVFAPPGNYLTRMEILYDETEVPYDWAVILGGTNDLSVGRGGEDIYEALQKVWAYPLGHGTKVLALTVPECGACSPDLDDRRDLLNDRILEHEAENYYTLDLRSLIPYWTMPEERRREIWDDGLHFTEKGYDLMGELIAQRMIELIGETKGIEKGLQPLKSELKVRNLDFEPKFEHVEDRMLGSESVLITEIRE